MIKKFIADNLVSNLNLEPTKGQYKVIEKLSEFLTNLETPDIFIIKGYAGTGKTTLVSSLVSTLKGMKVNTVLLAPTGRASKVLAGYTHKNAFTIHKKIFKQVSSKDGFGKFVLSANLHTNTIFVVDEASMISNQFSEQSNFGSGRLLDDLIEYVYTGKRCKLILIGDTAQLPPVGSSMSPALDRSLLGNFGFFIDEYTLTDVVRQEIDSGILCNATIVRDVIRKDGLQPDFPVFKLSGFPDFEHITGGELLDALSSSYDNHGIGQVKVLCYSNKRANQYNMGIRASVLWKEESLSKGDLVMVVKNNYFWIDESMDTNFIANGDIAEIISIKGYQERYEHRFADVTLKFSDYNDIELDAKIMVDSLQLENPSVPWEDMQKLFHIISVDYADVEPPKKRYKMVKEDPFFNALQLKYAYAITCHKAQGGQWDVVFIDQGYFVEDMLSTDYLRWLYTALTRATEKIYLVNFNKKFLPANYEM